MTELKIAFLFALARAENQNRVGWISGSSKWMPHESLEGGNDTIAYGHKLTDSDVESRLFEHGITEPVAIKMLLRDAEKAIETAKISWVKHQGTAQLPEKYLYVLADIVYNTGYVARGGKWRWPKLAQAIKDGDDQRVFEESLRWYRKPVLGEMVPLTSRSKLICGALGLEFYTV